jgi:hypothetical protein
VKDRDETEVQSRTPTGGLRRSRNESAQVLQDVLRGCASFITAVNRDAAADARAIA